MNTASPTLTGPRISLPRKILLPGPIAVPSPKNRTVGSILQPAPISALMFLHRLIPDGANATRPGRLYALARVKWLQGIYMRRQITDDRMERRARAYIHSE